MDNTAPGRLYFNTDALAERDRFPAFCEGMFRHVVGADIVQLGSMPFRGTLDVRRAGRVGVAEISVTSANISRLTHHISDGNDAIVIQLWRYGLAGLTQGKHEYGVTSSSGGLIIDNAKPARVFTEGSSQFWTLTIPRDTLAAATRDMAGVVGDKLTDSPAFRLLFKYLEESASNDLDDPRAAELFGEHIVDLTALALGIEGDARKLAQERSAIAVRRAAILREIEHRSGDHTLSAAAVAILLGITPRYVHLLLEESGQSFTHHVLKRRLDRATALLRDPQWRHRKIADIAAEAGFTDLSYFNRAFRRRYGATPSDIRHTAGLRLS
jgi:AraC-like DNA-binding protein